MDVGAQAGQYEDPHFSPVGRCDVIPVISLTEEDQRGFALHPWQVMSKVTEEREGSGFNGLKGRKLLCLASWLCFRALHHQPFFLLTSQGHKTC